MAIKRIQAGQYSVSDGRFIIKDGSSWYVLNSEQKQEFGPLPTLNSAKQYIEDGRIETGNHNTSTSHGRSQTRKENNAYLVAEAKNGNLAPLVITILVMVIFLLLFKYLENL